MTKNSITAQSVLNKPKKKDIYDRLEHGITQLEKYSNKAAVYINGLSVQLSEEITYAAINRNGTLFINEKNMDAVSYQQFLGILVHELMHLTKRHFDLESMGLSEYLNIDYRLLNIACDFTINDELVKIFPRMAEMDICFSHRFGFVPGLSEKEYYDLLKSKRDEELKQIIQQMNNDLDSGASLDELLDKYAKSGSSVGDNDDLPEELEEQLGELKERIQKEVDKKDGVNGRGNSSQTSGESDFYSHEFVSQTYVTKVIRKVLGQVTTSKYGQSKSYKKLSRRQYSEVLQKGKVNDRKRILVALDVSGSMDENKLNKATSFIRKIANQVNLEVYYLTYNVEIVQEPKKFQKSDRILTGGGTNGRVAQQLFENDDRFSMLFIVSDAQDNYAQPIKPTFGFFLEYYDELQTYYYKVKGRFAPFDYLWIDGSGNDCIN